MRTPIRIPTPEGIAATLTLDENSIFIQGCDGNQTRIPAALSQEVADSLQELQRDFLNSQHQA